MRGRIPTSRSWASSASQGAGIGNHGHAPVEEVEVEQFDVAPRELRKGEFKVEIEVMFILSSASHAMLKSVNIVCLAGRDVRSLKDLFATIVTASASSVSSHNSRS